MSILYFWLCAILLNIISPLCPSLQFTVGHSRKNFVSFDAFPDNMTKLRRNGKGKSVQWQLYKFRVPGSNCLVTRAPDVFEYNTCGYATINSPDTYIFSSLFSGNMWRHHLEFLSVVSTLRLSSLKINLQITGFYLESNQNINNSRKYATVLAIW